MPWGGAVPLQPSLTATYRDVWRRTVGDDAVEDDVPRHVGEVPRENVDDER